MTIRNRSGHNPVTADVGFIHAVGRGEHCRLVATLPISDGPTIEIWANYPDARRFYVTEPGIETTVHTTIRKAFNQAARHAGWG